MGYLITAHVFREKPDFSRLGELPKSIGYRAYLHGAANFYLLDAFRASKVPQYPFQTLIPSADIPLELPPALESLERLYLAARGSETRERFQEVLHQHRAAAQSPPQVPVFSFASDDDELDFACSASDDALSRLKCRCGDLVVSVRSHQAPGRAAGAGGRRGRGPADRHVEPQLGAARCGHPSARTPWNTQLHAIATEELQAFAGIKETILGLGSFDPPEDEPERRLVASR